MTKETITGTRIKKRALFIVITDYPGGAERISFALAGELASRPGWDVEVMIVSASLPESFSRRVLPRQVRLNFGPARSWYVSFPLLPFRLIFRRYDFVLTTHVYTNALLSFMRRARLVKIGRLVMRESMSLFDRYTGWKTRLFSWLYQSYGAEDLLIAQTGYMAKHIASRLPARSAKRLVVLPNPVDVDSIRLAASEPLDAELSQLLTNRTNILFCGRFVGFKRPGLALEVFQELAGDDETTQLIFMGAGPLEPDVRKDSLRLGLSGRTHFIGQQTNPYPVMAACQYGLLTSANEGFPNVVLEMMASGMKKIVVTACAGDLDSLTGVSIARTNEAAEIAQLLRQAIRSGEDCSSVYRSVAASRSPAAYVNRLLGVRAEDAAVDRSGRL